MQTGGLQAPIGENKRLVRRFFREFYDRRHLEIIDELFTPDYVHHRPDRGTMDFREFRRHELQMASAFPDMTREVVDQIAEGDKVVTSSVIRGTQTGDLPEIPATGRKIEVRSVVISRIRHGKLAEGYEIADLLGMYMQLDVIHMVSTLGKSRRERGYFPPITEWPG